MLKIDSYDRSDIGKKRANNEDYSGAFEPKTRRELNQSGRLYVVADGMGGHERGEVSSKYAVETLLKVYYEAPKIPPEKRLRDIIQQINQNLYAYAKENLGAGEKTGTTLVAAVVRGGNLLVANVGDSRAYLLRDGKIKQITRDHTLVGELVRAGALTEEEARESKYRNRLSRSVGADPKLEVDIHPPIPLRRGDIILLCTDGLTQYASPQDLLRAASSGNARDIVERLIRFANQRGGSDNITVLVIKYGKKFRFPAILPGKKLVLAGMSLMLLAVFSLIGWFGYSAWTSYTATPTSTGISTPTASPTPIPTATFTETPSPQPSETAEPTPSEETPPLTFTPEPPAPIGLVNCEYTVRPNETAIGIADKFNTQLDNVFRQDNTQENMRAIRVGEILIIKNVPADTCTLNGGVIQTPER